MECNFYYSLKSSSLRNCCLWRQQNTKNKKINLRVRQEEEEEEINKSSSESFLYFIFCSSSSYSSHLHICGGFYMIIFSSLFLQVLCLCLSTSSVFYELQNHSRLSKVNKFFKAFTNFLLNSESPFLGRKDVER